MQHFHLFSLFGAFHSPVFPYFVAYLIFITISFCFGKHQCTLLDSDFLPCFSVDAIKDPLPWTCWTVDPLGNLALVCEFVYTSHILSMPLHVYSEAYFPTVMMGFDILSQNKKHPLEIRLYELMWLSSQVRGAQQYWILPVMSCKLRCKYKVTQICLMVYTRARKCCQLLTYVWKNTDVHTGLAVHASLYM